MPVMDGIECTRRIREMEKDGTLTGHLPVIALTANAAGIIYHIPRTDNS
jgi:CheY-like chemotaxis protein